MGKLMVGVIAGLFVGLMIAEFEFRMGGWSNFLDHLSFYVDRELPTIGLTFLSVLFFIGVIVFIFIG